MKEIDCRGMACPAPVLQTKEMLEKENPDSITVTVDNEAARQNVTRFLESRNFNTSVRDEEDFYIVFGKSSDEYHPRDRKGGEVRRPTFQ